MLYCLSRETEAETEARADHSTEMSPKQLGNWHTWQSEASAIPRRALTMRIK